MFKQVLTTLIIASAMIFATLSAGEMTLLEEAAEFERLSASVTASGTGSIKVKRCDECDELRLHISPSTQLEVNGERRPLAELNNGALNAGTVFFDPDNSTVLRISGSR